MDEKPEKIMYEFTIDNKFNCIIK